MEEKPRISKTEEKSTSRDEETETSTNGRYRALKGLDLSQEQSIFDSFADTG